MIEKLDHFLYEGSTKGTCVDVHDHEIHNDHTYFQSKMTWPLDDAMEYCGQGRDGAEIN